MRSTRKINDISTVCPSVYCRKTIWASGVYTAVGDAHGFYLSPPESMKQFILQSRIVENNLFSGLSGETGLRS